MKSLGLVILLVLTSFGAMQFQGSMQTDPNSVPLPVEPIVATKDFRGVESSNDPLIAPIDTDNLAPSRYDFSHDRTATFHDHGDTVCASGCSLSRHPTETLTQETYQELLEACSAEAMDADNLAFETLLYFGRQTATMVDQHGTPKLSVSQAANLKRELLRQHARVSIRVLDGDGIRRTWTEDIRVPLDRRHVFEMKTDGVQPLVTSGTVKRVGLDHLWTRL